MQYIRETKANVTPPFMSDAAYGEARQCLPFVTTDAVLVDTAAKSIYLAWRQATPAQGWWVIGGGVKNGQSPLEAMARNFKRETSLDLPLGRFTLLHAAVNLTQWTVDEQISNVHIPFAVELSAVELEALKANLEQKEYAADKGIHAFTIEGLQQAIEEGVGYPQPILYYDALFGTNAYPEALARWQTLRNKK